MGRRLFLVHTLIGLQAHVSVRKRAAALFTVSGIRRDLVPQRTATLPDFRMARRVEHGEGNIDRSGIWLPDSLVKLV